MSEILKGKLGYKGETGDSAYEIAVKHGYTGTEEQWSEDFLNAENYYDKSEINTKCVFKGDFALIQGEHTFDFTEAAGSKSISISYPTGFNNNNCVVSTIGMKIEEVDDYDQGLVYTYGVPVGTSSSQVTFGLTNNMIQMGESNMLYYFSFPVSGHTVKMSYKIVLMKINTGGSL